MESHNSHIRILMLLENRPYQYDTRAQYHARALAASGYRVMVISPGIRHEPVNQSASGITLYHFPDLHTGFKLLDYFIECTYSTFMLSALTAWVVLFKGVDVISTGNPPDSIFVASIFPRLLKKKIVHDVCAPAPELFLARFGWIKKGGLLFRIFVHFENRACRLAHCVITVNESLRRLLIERHHLPPERVVVIRHAPELDVVHPTEPDHRLRLQAGTIFGYLGNVSDLHGAGQLLYALSYLDSLMGCHNWYCVLIGRVNALDTLRALARKLEIEKRVCFTGYLPREKWLPLLSAADICIEPSPISAVNSVPGINKLMEYMALSKPIVAYDLLEHRVTAADSALYAAPDDARDLARLMAYLVERPNLRKELGANGLARMQHGLAWSFQRDRLVNAYDRLFSS